MSGASHAVDTVRAAPRSGGCGTRLSVTVTASALAASGDAAASLRALANELLAPVRGEVGGVQLSPAIRAFRVAVRDSTAVRRIIAALQASPKVERVERDECAARAH